MHEDVFLEPEVEIVERPRPATAEPGPPDPLTPAQKAARTRAAQKAAAAAADEMKREIVRLESILARHQQRRRYWQTREDAARDALRKALRRWAADLDAADRCREGGAQ